MDPLVCFALNSDLLSSYPDKISLLRGNHESRQITQVYGFYGMPHLPLTVTHCLTPMERSVSRSTVAPLYGRRVAASLITSTLQRYVSHYRLTLPIGSHSSCVQIIDGEVLCVHGGLSPDIRTLDQIRVLSRAQEIPHEGAFCGE